MPVKTMKKLMEESYFTRFLNPKTTETASKAIQEVIQFAVPEVKNLIRIDQDFAE